MNKLVTIVGPSGVGKTTLAKALSDKGGLEPALEQHAERPFQILFKQDSKFALPNQLDYLLYRAEQEQRLRKLDKPAVMDGGLDMDFHGFTKLFHARGWLTDEEFKLCRRFHTLTRSLLPLPDLIVAMSASAQTIRARLASRNRINVASGEDAKLINKFLNEWLNSIQPDKILRVDGSLEGPDYSQSVQTILKKIEAGRPSP